MFNRIAIVGLGLVIGLSATLWSQTPARAALTVQQRRELGMVARELRSVAALIRQKKLDEAEKKLDELQSKVDTIAEGNEKDRQVLAVKRQLNLQRGVLDRAKSANSGQPAEGGAPEISFTKQIAPILKSRCGNCHVNRASGGLQFDTFANLVKGGRSGVPIVPKNPARSLLFRKLIAQGNQRMPKNGDALPAGELALIRRWIALGAPFDGSDRSAPIGAGGAGGDGGDVTIAKPTGNETVSFIRDVAPFMVNLCTRCHGGNDPRGGLSVVTFENLMKGGNSGRVLLPGNLDGSILWQRVGTPQPPDKRMPQGRARITTTNHADLKKWIEEGCKFDGGDPKAPLRRLIPTEEQLVAEELAKLSPEEFAQFRLKRSNEQWDRALPKDRPQYIEGKEVLVYGNAGAERMQVIYDWAEEHVKQLRSTFKVSGDRVWKGRLTIFVIKDRFGYEEFNLVVNGRQQIPPEMTGHSVVTTAMQDAYVVLQDVGDDVTADNPGMKFNVIDHVTGAFLKRAGGDLPDWIVRGTGVYMAARQDDENPYVKQLRTRVPAMLASLSKPGDLFADGTFSPSAVAAVGYTLVEYMTKTGGVGRFDGFVRSLQGGNNLGAAMKSVYQADPNAVAVAFIRNYKN